MLGIVVRTAASEIEVIGKYLDVCIWRLLVCAFDLVCSGFDGKGGFLGARCLEMCHGVVLALLAQAIRLCSGLRSRCPLSLMLLMLLLLQRNLHAQ